MAGKDWRTRARGALGRYRVLAWVTGVMLLVLVVEMVLKYLVRADDAVVGLLEWVPYAHGWIYVVYLVTVIDLWSTMRWSFGRLVAMVLAGVVPVLSFVVERRVHRDGEDPARGGPAAAASGRGAQRRRPLSAAWTPRGPAGSLTRLGT